MQQLRFILGSSSPRRVELLGQLGLDFEIVKPQTEEQMTEGELPQDYVIRNSFEKAQWVAEHLKIKPQADSPALIISADTVVVIDGKTLEKPASLEDAAAMLKTLSGRTHTVMTGVTLFAHILTPTKTHKDSHVLSQLAAKGPHTSFRVETKVTIKTLAANEINFYIRTGEPMDKAGSYAAQGLGSYMVERIDGSYTNVVGLPVCDVVRKLDEHFDIKLWELNPVTR